MEQVFVKNDFNRNHFRRTGRIRNAFSAIHGLSVAGLQKARILFQRIRLLEEHLRVGGHLQQLFDAGLEQRIVVQLERDDKSLLWEMLHNFEEGS